MLYHDRAACHVQDDARAPGGASQGEKQGRLGHVFGGSEAAERLLASAPALGSWTALPLALVVTFVVVARRLNEEKYLAASLPGYHAYRRQVRYRLIPFVW